MIFADKIIELRKKSGLSQEELAEKINVSRQAVSKWESMQSTPDINKIIALSEIFGVSTDYLLKDDANDSEVCVSAESDSTLKKVSLNEANKFLTANNKNALLTALGIALCIMCVVPVVAIGALLPSFEELSVVFMFMIVAAGVALIVSASKIMKPFRYLERENIETEYGVSGMTREKKEKFTPLHIRDTIIGIILCIMCVTPPIIFEQMNKGELGGELGAALMFIMVAGGVFFIVKSAIINKGYSILLEEERFSREKKIKNSKKTYMGAVMGIYWSLTTALYLGISFLCHNFNISWVIWVVAGVLCVPTVIITNIIENKS